MISVGSNIAGMVSLPLEGGMGSCNWWPFTKRFMLFVLFWGIGLLFEVLWFLPRSPSVLTVGWNILYLLCLETVVDWLSVGSYTLSSRHHTWKI